MLVHVLGAKRYVLISALAGQFWAYTYTVCISRLSLKVNFCSVVVFLALNWISICCKVQNTIPLFIAFWGQLSRRGKLYKTNNARLLVHLWAETECTLCSTCQLDIPHSVLRTSVRYIQGLFSDIVHYLALNALAACIICLIYVAAWPD